MSAYFRDMRKLFIIPLLLLSLISSQASAANFDESLTVKVEEYPEELAKAFKKASTAFRKGDYVTAKREPSIESVFCSKRT